MSITSIIQSHTRKECLVMIDGANRTLKSTFPFVCVTVPSASVTGEVLLLYLKPCKTFSQTKECVVPVSIKALHCCPLAMTGNVRLRGAALDVEPNGQDALGAA
jgi:hypothetical protein